MPLKNIIMLLRALPLCLFLAGFAPAAEAAVSKTSKRIIRNAAPPLNVVPGFTATALSVTSIQWSWSTGSFTGSGITGFHLYSSSTPTVIDFSLASGTSYYIDTGLAADKQYTRWITSYDGTGQGSDSDHIEKYTYAQPPGFFFLSEVTATSARSTWTFSAATAYAVECSTDNGATYVRNRDVFVPWEDLVLLSNRDYIIRLGAVNGDNELTPGIYSASESTTTPPMDMVMTGVAVSSFAIQWKWSTGTFVDDGVTDYKIYHSSLVAAGELPAATDAGEVLKAINDPTVDSWTETFVDLSSGAWSVQTGTVTIDTFAANSRHTRWIRAVGLLESTGRNPYRKYTYATAPATAAVGGFGETNMAIGAGVPFHASNFMVDYATGPANLALSKASVVGTNVGGLTGNTKYDFRLGAINGDEELTPYSFSYATSAILRAMTMPAPPSLFAASPLTDTILNFTWSTSTYLTPSYISGYDIGYDCITPPPENKLTICASPFVPGVTTSSYSLTDLMTNSAHQRYVRAAQTDPDWNAGHPMWPDPYWEYQHSGSAFTAPAIAATFATPPNDVSFYSVRSSTVGLVWNEPIVPAAKYTVYRSTRISGPEDQRPWVFLSSVTGNTFQDTGLTPSTTYSYRIGAVNMLGLQTVGLSTATNGYRRDYSFVSSTITKHISPTLSGVAIGTSAITWSWTNTVPGVLSYNFYTSTDGVLATGVATPYAEIYLSSANTRYVRRVRSLTSFGEGDYSEASVSTLANPPAAPVITSSGVHTMSLYWVDSDNSTRYKLDRSPDKISWTTVKDWTDVFTSTGLDDTGLRFETTYYYAVRGFNYDGVVSVSSSISAANMTLPLPSAYSAVFATAAVSQSVTKPLPGLGVVTVSLPAGSPDSYFSISTNAAASPVEISTTSLDTATGKLTSVSLLAGSIMELHLYDVFGSPLSSNLPSPARITIAYTDANSDDIVDGTSAQAVSLRLFSLDTSALVWNQLANSMLDKGAKTVYADVPHFSFYALGSVTSAAGTIADVFAYPNPYKPGSAGVFGASVYGEGIVFESLPAGSKVRIFSLAGGLVRELTDSDGDGRCLWDARNADGARAASGTYVYLVTSPAGGKKSGRIAIIK